jgi:hypothetical protein
LVGIKALSREKYERRCPSCRTLWTIERRLVKETPEMVVNVLDWMIEGE